MVEKRLGRPPRTLDQVLTDVLVQLQTLYVEDESGCWLWTGLLWNNGYGRLRRNRKDTGLSSRAHVAVWQSLGGEIPLGMFVCHRCDKKRCINPKHLWIGTNQENQRDAVLKGTFEKIWTKERRAWWSEQIKGVNHPMYGKRGPLATCYGRTGEKHPMFGKHHTDKAKAKISAGVRRFHSQKENR